MNLITIEQLTAYLLLIVFLFGIALGVVGGAIFGSRRGALHWATANDPLSLGALSIYGVYVRDDSGYLRGILPGSRYTSGDPRADDDFGSQGKEANR